MYKRQEFDKVIVLEEGEIIESGTPAELISSKGYYYDILTKQSVDESTTPIE